jgi:hypothetical protein
MIEEFSSLLADINPQLPAYFLVKGAKAVPVPQTKEEYENLLANEYQSLAENVVYEELSQEVISALHDITRRLGGRLSVLFAHVSVAPFAYEAEREGSPLQTALSAKKEPEPPSAPNDEGAEGARVSKRRSRR